MGPRALLAAIVVPLAACSAEEATDPSYLLVELLPAETAPTPARAARVQVTAGGAEVTSLCVDLDGPPGQVAGSFVLRRDAGKPVADRVTLSISGYESLAGQDATATGKEVSCPPQPPPEVGPVQVVEVAFCERQARRLTVHVGAVCGCTDDAGAPGGGAQGCGCAGGEVCGAGLTSAGLICGDGTCCGGEITDGCALEVAP